jgi:hypothetical protein
LTALLLIDIQKLFHGINENIHIYLPRMTDSVFINLNTTLPMFRDCFTVALQEQARLIHVVSFIIIFPDTLPYLINTVILHVAGLVFGY